jgi:hypothetical protein
MASLVVRLVVLNGTLAELVVEPELIELDEEPVAALVDAVVV